MRLANFRNVAVRYSNTFCMSHFLIVIPIVNSIYLECLNPPMATMQIKLENRYGHMEATHTYTWLTHFLKMFQATLGIIMTSLSFLSIVTLRTGNCYSKKLVQSNSNDLKVCRFTCFADLSLLWIGPNFQTSFFVKYAQKVEMCQKKCASKISVKCRTEGRVRIKQDHNMK